MSPVSLGRPRITPQQFTTKWSDVELKERAVAQEHFLDVCALVGAPTPAQVDKKGEWFAFEKGVEKGALAGSGLKKRSLTNLYNLRPTWLANAHAALDGTVFAAYGWPKETNDLAEEKILKRLLALNLERARSAEDR